MCLFMCVQGLDPDEAFGLRLWCKINDEWEEPEFGVLGVYMYIIYMFLTGGPV